MISRLASATAVMLTASSLAAAQTYSACNPLKETGCPADPAVGTTQTIDFTKGESDFFTPAIGTHVTYDPTLGAVFTINSVSDAPTFTSKDYILFGKVDVTVRASLGTGIVTSFVLQSDDLDEIDWEWLGGDDTQVQTNYFSKGDTTTYDRGGFSGVYEPQTEFHTYTIDWNADRVNWIVDGAIVRTLTYADAKNGASYPQTPMQIKLGTWCAGGPDTAAGTVEWAGGYTDFSKAPFNGYYQSVTIQDYMNGASAAKQYVYGDKTGTYESIKVETETTDESSGSDPSSSQSASSAATSPTATSVAATSPAATSSDATTSIGSQAVGSTASTLSTVTSSASFKSSVTSGITLATGAPVNNAGSVTNGAGSDSSSDAVSSGSATSSSSSSRATSAVVSSGNKSAVNFAFLGAVLFAFLSL
ncbi:hypothetical protein VPNG_09980 [Cytospora leucostoma]|uniref:Crh-like protein n=1 Tax=Cytospora leucostoma TaxID=1230097 RepID=A0A423VK71_9PEZI|nr:hypothetical protein VPNG_09980 [Cytospora leucostoma]